MLLNAETNFNPGKGIDMHHITRILFLQTSRFLSIIAWMFCAMQGGEVGAAPVYSVTPLGLPGEKFSFPRGIDAAGDVVGISVDQDGHGRGFLDHDGKILDLGSPGGFTVAISNSGLIAAVSGDGVAFWNTDGSARTGTGPTGRPITAINDSGQIIGQLDYGLVPTGHGYYYSNGVTTDLGTLGGSGTTAVALNNSGQVVGRSMVSENLSHAFLYQSGRMIDITPMSPDSQATGINAGGVVVGTIYFGSNGYGDSGFVYDHGKMTILNGLAGGLSSTANGINSAGQIVGTAYVDANFTSHGILYSGGEAFDLNDLIPPSSDWTVRDGEGINDLGQIIAYGIDKSGHNSALLLNPEGLGSMIPVPEPSTTILIVLGIVILIVNKKMSCQMLSNYHLL